MGASVIASCDASPVLESAEHVLDAMALAVEHLVIGQRNSLHILCEQFLLFVESKAVRGLRLTMGGLSLKFDELLIVQGHEVFTHYDSYLAQKAKSHAQREFDLWRERTKRLPPAERRAA